MWVASLELLAACLLALATEAVAEAEGVEVQEAAVEPAASPPWGKFGTEVAM